MSQGKPSSRTWNAVPWVLVVPVAVLGYVAGYTVFFHLARWNLGHVISNPEPIVPLFAGAAGAIAFLLVGAGVAPSFRGVVALILLIAQVAFVSVYSALHFAGAISGRGDLDVGLEFAGNLVGVGVAFYLVFRAFGWKGSGPGSNLWREPTEYV